MFLTAIATAVPVEWPIASGGNGHFYEVILDGDAGWNAAQSAALADGGYLTTITSTEEQDFVEELLRDEFVPTGGFWIGLREQSEGDWQWVTGEPFVYDNWAPTQPDNAGGIENRGQLLWTRGDEEPTVGRRGWWNDAPEPGWANNPFDPALIDLDRRGYVVEYVPEPSAALLAALGGALLLAGRRRRLTA